MACFIHQFSSWKYQCNFKVSAQFHNSNGETSPWPTVHLAFVHGVVIYRLWSSQVKVMISWRGTIRNIINMFQLSTQPWGVGPIKILITPFSIIRLVSWPQHMDGLLLFSHCSIFTFPFVPDLDYPFGDSCSLTHTVPSWLTLGHLS